MPTFPGNKTQTDCLTPQLKGLEGWRVEVVDIGGEIRRFIVDRNSTNPEMAKVAIHLELKRRNSSGGYPASKEYRSVTRLYRVRSN